MAKKTTKKVLKKPTEKFTAKRLKHSKRYYVGERWLGYSVNSTTEAINAVKKHMKSHAKDFDGNEVEITVRQIVASVKRTK